MIPIDDLRQMSTIELTDVALASEDEPSFWILSGMLTWKLFEAGYKDEAVDLWNLGHQDHSPTGEARDYLVYLKTQILIS